MPELTERLNEALSGRYSIERELGHGGMAFVYAARDIRYDRRVAIKVLKPEIAEHVGAERFLREIDIEARLQHPHILPLLDSGVADGLLYYVMPYVEGESLRDCLRREGQLPIPETLRIAGEVADALDYAHSRAIIHRDIKPENILLAGDHAFVADFGIARAARAAGGNWHDASGTTIWETETGVTLGTLGYMSPEQATAAPHLDGRSDQYSLACTIYEMLAGNGEMPYPGASLQVIVAKMLTQPPPSVRILRESVPGLMDEALQRALSKAPADRFRVCADFIAALRREPTLAHRVVDAARTRSAKRLLIAMLAIAAAVLVASKVIGGGGGGATSAPDTTRYVIFPFQHEGGAATPPGEMQRMQDAFSRWEGVRVVGQPRLQEVLEPGGASLTQPKAAEVARRLAAGRYVEVSVSPLGEDSLRVSAALFDAAHLGSALSDTAIRLPGHMAGADAAFDALADHLLFRGTPAVTPSASTTRSLPAAESFGQGMDALSAWDLVRADSAFSAAVRFDSHFAQGHLWATAVRFWAGSAPTAWHFSAEQAALGRERLSPTDRIMADALAAQVRDDLSRACRLWEDVIKRESEDYVGWIGWARCQQSDSAVVPDLKSRSGWSFRTSYQRMLGAYERAFELHPAIFGAYRASPSSNSLEGLLFTRGNARRAGIALPPDTTTFLADPSWEGDSLAFVPYPRRVLSSQEYTTSPVALDEAVRRQRLRFRRFAEIWVAAFPSNAGAMEALATSLAMLGDAAAIDTLQRAVQLAGPPSERLRLAGVSVWMHVAFGLPFQRERLLRARTLADSLLRRHPPGDATDPRLLAGLAALTGRADAAARYMREAGVGEALHVPPPLRPTAQVLLMYAAMGGPADSLDALERAFVTALPRIADTQGRDVTIDRWLVRAATLAFPQHRLQSLHELAGRNNYLLGFQIRLADGDSASLRQALEIRRQSQRPMSPELFTLDGLYPEAELWVAVGDPGGAARCLDPTLALLPRKPPSELADPVRAASLVRALALRARIAQHLGDSPNAARWAAAVATLWSDADSFLQPTVREMRRLASDE